LLAVMTGVQFVSCDDRCSVC